MTNREVISDIRSINKLLSSDNLLNDRSVLAELNSSAALLIRREINLRKLWQSPNIFTNIGCLEMIEVPLAECCEYISEKTISRSKHKLPKIGEAQSSLLIQQVASVDGMYKFKEATPMRYSNILKIYPKAINYYFWIYNNYLYVTLDTLKLVRISAYFEEDVPNFIMFPENCACGQDKGEECLSALDKEFKAPVYLMEQIKSLTHEKLLRIYQQVGYDKNSDNKDDTSK